jgi:N-acetylneuraminic acid mutarotase
MKQVLKLSAFCLMIVLVFSISCKKELSCENCNDNKPPIANAGTDQKITIPVDSVRLNGSASKDLDGKISEWLWKKIDGPAAAAIAKATSPTTIVKNLVAGIYSFELKVTDDKGAFAKDTVQIILDNPLINKPPIANAGPDQTLILPVSTVTLNGSQSADPDNNITSYSWLNISGPSVTTIANANSVVTQVSGLVYGVYLFELKVTDAGGLYSTDTVKVAINEAAAVMNCGESNRPVMNAKLIPFGKLSEPSSGMAVASAGNKIVFAGASLSGSPANYGSSAVHIFDITTQNWSTATLSAWRADVAAVAAGNKIFFAGGRLGNGGSYNYFSTVDIYDVSTNKWSVANLSQPRAYIAAATVGDKVFFAGGEREWPHPVSDRVDIYDLSSNSWSTTSLSLQRNGITAVTANNKIYFAGGSNQIGGVNNVTDIIDVYDNTTNSWSTTNLSESKAFFAGITVHNKIYWAGGDNSTSTPSCKVEIKNLSTNTSATAFLFHPFNYMVNEGQNAIIKDEKIIWFATLDPFNGNITDKFNIYDLATDKWSIGLLPVKINGASVISVNNVIYVAGGYIDGRMSDQVWKLEF